MSLQVWLPLNGSLDEKISDKAISAATGRSLPTSGAMGKLGPGYTFSNSGIKIENIQATSQMSFAMWVKLSSNTFCHLLDFRSSDTNGYQPIYYENGRVQIYSAKNNSGAYVAAPLGDCQWHHLVITMQEGKGELYFDGISKGSISGIAMYENTTTTLNIGCRHNGNNPCPGIIQDVRIYNHCLSPKEVKLLAQGLVVHYKLDNGNHTNLISGSYNFSGIVSSGGTTQSDPITGIISRKYNNTTADYWELVAWNGIITANANDIYTASFLARSENATKLTVYLWNNNSGVQVSNIKSSQGHNKSGTDGNCELSLTTEWKQYWITWTFNSTTTPLTKNLLFRLFKNNAAEIAHVKLEKGSIPTAYGLSPSEMSQFGYDCSGYANHGTVSTTFEMSTDSPRYSHSTVFPGNTANRITNTTTQFYYTDNFSWSCWVKHKYPNSTSFAFTVGRADYSPDWGYGLQVISASSMRIRFGSSSYTVSLDENSWHHLVFTKSGNNITIYVDGIPTNYTFTGTLPAYTNSQGLGIGCFWYSSGALYPYHGQISDFRIYATALSAAAVKEIYQSSISIFNNGTLQASEIVESHANIKFKKNGIVQTELISEIGYTNKMKTKTLPDGSAWARIHWLDVTTNATYFANEDEVQECVNKTNRFSLMKYVDKFKSKDNKYEFMLTYPKISTTGYNRWTQTSSPNETGSVENVIHISTSWNTYNGGIRQYSGDAAYHCSGDSGWYAPIGQYKRWTLNSTSQIPAANGNSTTETELWVRIDNLPKLTKLSMFNEALQAHQIYEL